MRWERGREKDGEKKQTREVGHGGTNIQGRLGRVGGLMIRLYNNLSLHAMIYPLIHLCIHLSIHSAIRLLIYPAIRRSLIWRTIHQ